MTEKRHWTEDNLRNLTEKVIGCYISVHKALGPGLLESAYAACLAYEMTQHNIYFGKEVPLPVVYRDVKLDCGYRMGFVVEGILIIELKAVEKIIPLHKAQTLSYLKLANLPLALLMNFSEQKLVDGITRLRA